MKAEDLGIDLKTGYHDRRLTTLENRFLGILWENHVGKACKISADHLAVSFDRLKQGITLPPAEVEKIAAELQIFKEGRKHLDHLKREVRHIYNHLLTCHDHVPILSKAGPDGGYWIAGDEDEAAAFYDTFRQRGITGLVKASRGKRAVLVDMMQQLSFEFEELVDKTELAGQIERRKAAATPVEVVDAFMAKMLKNPEKFADGLRKIGQKYGSVLLPKKQVEALTAKAAELQAIVNSLKG